jgi:hypothetical protein
MPLGIQWSVAAGFKVSILESTLTLSETTWMVTLRLESYRYSSAGEGAPMNLSVFWIERTNGALHQG